MTCETAVRCPCGGEAFTLVEYGVCAAPAVYVCLACGKTLGVAARNEEVARHAA